MRLMSQRLDRSMWTIGNFDIIYRKTRRKEEDMARILRAMFGGMFLERDPFDVGPGDSYYLALCLNTLLRRNRCGLMLNGSSEIYAK